MDEQQKIVNLKNLFCILATRDLLIEKGIITQNEYKKAITDKIENSDLDILTKQKILKHV